MVILIERHCQFPPFFPKKTILLKNGLFTPKNTFWPLKNRFGRQDYNVFYILLINRDEWIVVELVDWIDRLKNLYPNFSPVENYTKFNLGDGRIIRALDEIPFSCLNLNMISSTKFLGMNPDDTPFLIQICIIFTTRTLLGFMTAIGNKKLSRLNTFVCWNPVMNIYQHSIVL